MKLGMHFPESGTKCVLQSQVFSVMEDIHKRPEHPLSKTLREKWCPVLPAIAPQIMEETPRKPMLPAKIMLAFHFMWFDWHDMVAKVPVPLASGITNVPSPDFCSILQNLGFGFFTLLLEYPLRYCRITATVRGGACWGVSEYGLIGEETVEKPRREKIKSTGRSKTGGGGGTWKPIPSREVDDTLFCGVSERVPRPGEEYVRPGRRPSTPPRVRWPGNLLGLSLARGVHFELRPQVGPLSLRGRGYCP